MKIETPLEMPLLYFYRGKNSDRNKLQELMSFIPDGDKHRVSKQYERIYMSTKPRNRAAANEYLEAEAQKYR